MPGSILPGIVIGANFSLHLNLPNFISVSVITIKIINLKNGQISFWRR